MGLVDQGGTTRLALQVICEKSAFNVVSEEIYRAIEELNIGAPVLITRFGEIEGVPIHERALDDQLLESYMTEDWGINGKISIPEVAYQPEG